MAIPAVIKALSKVSSEVSTAKNVSEGNVEAIASKGISKSLSKKFNPDKRVEANKEGRDIKAQNQAAYNPDKRIEKTDVSNSLPEDINDEISNESELVSQGELYTDSDNRLSQALGSQGEWLGEPGKSEFVPNDPKAKQALEKHGQESIRYDENCEPEFGKVAEETVEIDHMTEDRLGAGNNFEQADTKLAEKWNNEKRLGRDDWTSDDVNEWVEDNSLTRHERLDKKTVDFVDSDIHKACQHYGGCAECRVRDSLGGFDFDE